MRKRIKKIQLKGGYDAEKSLVHKLVTDFVRWGKITTTDRRVKYLKGIMDRLTYKAIKNSQADQNMLMSALRDKKMVKYMTTTVASGFKNRTSGFTTVIKFGPRQGDGAITAQLKWVRAIDQFAKPIVKEPKENEKKDEVKELGEDQEKLTTK